MKTAEAWSKEISNSTKDVSKELCTSIATSEIKQIQLDAMKEGMRRAAKQTDVIKAEPYCDSCNPLNVCDYINKAILIAAEQLTEKDL